MQHFGLYFDQWNNKGILRLASKEFNLLNRKGESDAVFGDILLSKESEYSDSDIGKISDSLLNRKTMLAGILVAVKEANLQ